MRKHKNMREDEADFAEEQNSEASGAPETADEQNQNQQHQAGSAESGQVEGVQGDEMNQLRKALEESQSELERHREALLRMQAEMDNQRKRLAREADKSRRFALERMMKDLLQVRDSLERGLEVDQDSATVEGLREGKALTLRVLSKVMEDHGLEVIDPKGEPFNPEFHEAMTMAPSPEHAENTVIEVLQKGFKLNDRLIRPAMVVVSKNPDQDALE